MTISPAAQELILWFEENRRRMFRRNVTRGPVRPWLEEYSSLVDEVLQRIHEAAWATARAAHPEISGAEPELILLAIGGYGRRELCPFSDVDIAFVPAEEENVLLDAVIKETFRLMVEVLIDGAQLEVGYAYRPVSDYKVLDHSSKAALLEGRLIVGNERLLERVRDEVHRTWDGVAFLLEKAAERRERSQRLALSLYAVEPNLKEGAGALRDVHFALWSAAAVLQVNRPLEELVSQGVVTAADAERVSEASDFFLRLRTWLHLHTKCRTDVLRLEFQDKCARAFNYTGSGGLAAQNLLADYYRHAEVAARFCDRVLGRLLEGPLPFGGHFFAARQRLYAAHPFTLNNHPELLLTPFALARKYGFTLDPHLDRGIDANMPRLDDVTRRRSEARDAFFALIGDVGNAAAALTELRERGLLQAFVPEIGVMMHLAPPDPSHQLSVGEHSIHAVRQLDHLWHQRVRDDELHALWNGVEDLEVLVLGTLLHDVGKIEQNTDHSVSGEKLAAKIAERLGLSPVRIETLKLLVRRHLTMPRMARLRDLATPATVRRLVSYAHDVPTLKMLYLLALADTYAVGEHSYSHLDVQAMRELYERALMAMTRAEAAQVLSDHEKREQLVQQERERVRRDLRHLELDDTTLQRLSDTLPAAYILNTPLPTMATHLKFLDQLPEEQMIVDFYSQPGRGFAEMTVVAYDGPEPGLLSKLCGVVHAAGAEILLAHVYTLSGNDLNSKWMASAPVYGRDVVLDRLHIVAGGRDLSATHTAKIGALMREVLLGQQSVEDALRAAGKKVSVPVVPHKIEARNDLSDEHTAVTIVSDNVSGLLYHVTKAIAAVGLDIHTAKISTWGGRAEDGFYVTRRLKDQPNRKLTDEEIGSTLDALRRKLAHPKEVRHDR